jgi:8-oxo-dGTP pyrophosphatase MutT (NUDIX family)
MVAPWTLKEVRQVVSFRIGALVHLRGRSPRTNETHDFYELRFPDWVNVVPVTPDGRVLLIRQFRAGSRELTLEIPGGLMEPGETPLESARRELLEETGYDTDDWRMLGNVRPNPAIQGNRCHTLLARNVKPVAEQRLEPAEDIDVVPTPLEEVPGMIESGAIDHTLVLSAFLRLWLAGGAAGALASASRPGAAARPRSGER